VPPPRGQQTGKTDKNVRRHSLDRLYASMIKNPALACWASEIPRLRSSLTHSSAFSFSGTPLCAGHHGISMVMSGLALRRTTICFLGGRGVGRSGAASVAPPCSSWARFFPNMLSAMCRRRVLFCKITPLREFSFALILTFR